MPFLTPFLEEGSPTTVDYKKRLVPLFYPLYWNPQTNSGTLSWPHNQKREKLTGGLDIKKAAGDGNPLEGFLGPSEQSVESTSFAHDGFLIAFALGLGKTGRPIFTTS